MSAADDSSLRRKTARTLGWNSLDRIASQVLYAITGIVLANVLPKEDFGLVGAILVFQAFATIFVDSGFGAALLQKKEPTEADYSTVFWFNLGMCLLLYGILYLLAPAIADLFQRDARLIPLSRVMFLSFIINGLAIVQTNRLMKAMTVRRVAVSNLVGLVVSGILGIWLAVKGWGAWALVWQTLALGAIKTTWLWVAGRWRPALCFSMTSLRSIMRVGMGVFTSSLLNTIFLNIYSFVIGVWYSLTALGDYTQADKWSKMGSASLSQIITATFVPLLARFQDDSDKYREMMGKVNRLTAFLLFPFMGGLAAMAPAIFHTLFGQKWDSAIILFQLLTVRGIFTVLCSLYTNYLLSLGYARSLVRVEIVKDTLTLVAILATVWLHSVDALVWGQLVAGVITWVAVLWLTRRATGYTLTDLMRGMRRYLLYTLVAVGAALLPTLVMTGALMTLLAQCVLGLFAYIALLALRSDPVLQQGLAYLRHKA